MSLRLSGLLVLVLGVITLGAAGCGVADNGGGDGLLTTVTSGTTVARDTMKVNVYFSRGEEVCAAVRVIPRTQATGAAAMKALLAGPTAEEKAMGMTSSIPEGTTLLGVDIANGVATVDLSKEYGSAGGNFSMIMRLAEVVFTLTQFPTVEGVELKLDGEAVDVFGEEGFMLAHPMSRADYEDLSPAILVESPLFGETVSSPVRIRGTSNTFEATCLIKIVDQNGQTLATQVVTATSGSGERGTFDVTVPFTVDQAGAGTIMAYEESAKDGSVINPVEIQVQLEK